MSKRFIAILLATLLPISLATANEKSRFGGFSIGLGAGVTSAAFSRSSEQDRINGTTGTLLEVQTQLVRTAGASPVGDLSLNYGWTISNFYLGLNLAGN